MLYVALALGALALLVAWIALQRAGGFAARFAQLDTDARRRVENLEAELESKLALTRKLMVMMQRGQALTPEMIEEGRLWSDASAADAARMVATGKVHVLDVRTPSETAAGIIPGAKLIPVDELERRVRELPRDGQPLLVYCAAGARSAAACEFLSQQGFANLHNLEGGFSSWTGPRAKV